MRKHFRSSAIVICIAFVILSLCSSKCNRDPCHENITVVNNSDSIVSICDLGLDTYHNYWLGKITEVKPKESAEIPMTIRWCLEDLLLTSDPATNYTLYVLPADYTFVETTTYDSLYIVYDVLKTIDLMELGPDSLLRTNYTVYYP